MPPKKHIPGPESPMIFEGALTEAVAGPSGQPDDLDAMVARIAAAARAHPHRVQDDLSPAFADLGYGRRSTLAANPPYLPNIHNSRNSRRSRGIARAAIGPQYGEEEGVGYPDGQPLYHQPPIILTGEQKAANLQGVERVRDAVAEFHLQNKPE